jgi:hypothetical protein
MMKRPVTRTPASEARNSTVVSRGFSSTGVSSTTTAVSFFGTGPFLSKNFLATAKRGAFADTHLSHYFSEPA